MGFKRTMVECFILTNVNTWLGRGDNLLTSVNMTNRLVPLDNTDGSIYYLFRPICVVCLRRYYCYYLLVIGIYNAAVHTCFI